MAKNGRKSTEIHKRPPGRSSFHGRFPPEMHPTKFGVVVHSQENDRGSIRCFGRLAPEDRGLCSECFGSRFPKRD
jgi:hypothetical protein